VNYLFVLTMAITVLFLIGILRKISSIMNKRLITGFRGIKYFNVADQDTRYLITPQNALLFKFKFAIFSA